MVTRFPNIHFSKRVCQGCVLGKNTQKKFEKGKAWRASSPLELIQSDHRGSNDHRGSMSVSINAKGGIFGKLVVIDFNPIRSLEACL
jgi:hypothetical protein